MPSHPSYNIDLRDSRLDDLLQMRRIVKMCGSFGILWGITATCTYWFGVSPLITYISTLFSICAAVMLFVFGMDFDMRRIRTLLWGHIVLCDPHEDTAAREWLKQCDMHDYHHWALGVFVFGNPKQAIAMKLVFH